MQNKTIFKLVSDTKIFASNLFTIYFFTPRAIVHLNLGYIYQAFYFTFPDGNRNIMGLYQIRTDQSLSRVRLFATPWIAASQASLSITNSRSSPRLTSIESVMPSSHLILCRPLLLLPPSLPASSFPMSQLFAWGVCMNQCYCYNYSVHFYQTYLLQIGYKHTALEWAIVRIWNLQYILYIIYSLGPRVQSH